MGINYQIRMFEKSLVDCLNASDLPIELKRVVLENTLNNVNKATEEVIQNEILKESEDIADGIPTDTVEE